MKGKFVLFIEEEKIIKNFEFIYIDSKKNYIIII